MKKLNTMQKLNNETNVTMMNSDFQLLKGIFVKSVMIEIGRFNYATTAPFGEVGTIMRYIAHCGKELKFHTLLLPNMTDILNDEIFTNPVISTFVLCATDRFFIEINPFKEVLYKHFLGLLVSKYTKGYSVMPDALIDTLSSSARKLKDTGEFFDFNNWIVCVMMIMLTHQELINQISIAVKNK